MAKNSPYRPHPKWHDYHTRGIYLITLVVKHRDHILSELNMDAKKPGLILTETGKAVVELSFEDTRYRVCPDVEITVKIDEPDTLYPLVDFYICNKFEYTVYAIAESDGTIHDTVLGPEILPFTYQCNLFVAQNKKGYYFADEAGNAVIPGPFRSATPFEECLSVVETNERRFYLINDKGERLMGPYRAMEKSMYSDFYLVTDTDGTKGYVNRAGDWICRNCSGSWPAFNRAWVRSENTFGGFRLMDETGRFVTPFAVASYNGYREYTDEEVARLRLGIQRLFLEDHPSGHSAFWLDANAGRILWPLEWNDPCAETNGAILWPEGACGHENAIPPQDARVPR